MLHPIQAGYFDPAVRSDPWLHLWSLWESRNNSAIAWPLVLFFLWNFAVEKKRSSRKLLTGILLIACVSFAFDVTSLRGDPAGTFYSLMTRVWELLAGGALASYTLIHGEVRRRFLREFLSASGGALIAAGLVLMNENTPAPGWWSLLPVLGAVWF